MNQKTSKLPLHLNLSPELRLILGLVVGTCYLIRNDLLTCPPDVAACQRFPLLIHFIKWVAHHTYRPLRPAEHEVTGRSLRLLFLKEGLAIEKVQEGDHCQKVHKIAVGTEAHQVDHCEGRILGLRPETLGGCDENADEGMQRFHGGQKYCPKYDELIESGELPPLSQQIRHLRIVDED